MCTSKYHFLINEFSSKPILFDLDQGEDELQKLASGSQVISFWNDPAWVKSGSKKEPPMCIFLIPDQREDVTSRSH